MLYEVITSSELVTFAEGITKAAGPAVAVQYDLGCNDTDTVHFGGIWASGLSDITIVVIGLTPVREGEEGDAFLAEHGGDKANLQIPAAHLAFLKKLRASNVITSYSIHYTKLYDCYRAPKE